METNSNIHLTEVDQPEAITTGTTAGAAQEDVLRPDTEALPEAAQRANAAEQIASSLALQRSAKRLARAGIAGNPNLGGPVFNL